MIPYNRSAYGWRLIFQIHGSAVYRSVLPSMISVAIYFLFRKINVEETGITAEDVLHPYAVGVLVSSSTFLIVFKLNQSYGRYWEACSSTNQFMSKWMDATTHTGVYHMQCDHYTEMKPPAFYDYPELNSLFMTRDRERLNPIDDEDEDNDDDKMYEHNDDTGLRNRKQSSQIRENNDNGGGTSSTEADIPDVPSSRGFSTITHPASGEPKQQFRQYYTKDPKEPLSTFVDPRRPDNMDPKGFASIQGGRTPPLFLQELAHLSSLMNAVALSTLRNDMEGCQSPLGIYEYGGPWPEVDPNNEEWIKKKGFKALSSAISSFLGVGLSEVERSKHNAAMPLPVIGGVSDAEIRLLQIARGPWAKTQLCFNWLTEFIIREHLAGSLGTVGPPIISRIVQFLGDGMIYYNHARKIMSIPFPFVHAQLSVMFVIIMVAVIPYLMHQYTDDPLVGAILTFLTVLCLSGINEVARDLENPFRNFPNELPLVNFQAQYNEALLTMYSGYHPDLFWDGDHVLRKASRMTDIQEEEVQHEKATQEEPVVSQRKTPTSDVASSTDTAEIATLKQQLEEQAKLIETLFAKIG
ncbi:hypothetical protein FRACYDRAFT_207537 [Fragilariopsis cylindrus CCMP1102]|uniref:Uncharacterized protein n=1 Tax=Fragilariopsis cylindrus CCMP1102 TaxID=635003 RepID=A0A1E7FGB6_9STRA|nr:hypothetical protein FRACYDRAFT_207537 [Fragilariopsis cylindrus CCMP1102]|eukprot:OEU17212.1 hypothetical protein FRACYDRAFT_207537 [Fragilariopsis cylindrus CCMP1102]